MISKIQHTIQHKIDSFINKRSPSSTSIELIQKRIYIFPSAIGALYCGLVVLMFVTAINYQNNLLFSFSCLLVGLFVSAIAFTYANLSGVRITAGSSDSVFEGENAVLNIELSAGSSVNKQGLKIGFSRSSVYHLDEVGHSKHVVLACAALKRGRLQVPKLTVFSHYPLGLLRCWSWVKLDFHVLVYPKPVFVPFKFKDGVLDEDPNQMDTVSLVKGQAADDFYGFKHYQSGDSLKHIAWRQYAKTGQLLTKEFSSIQGGGHLFEWAALTGVDNEERLQILCGWILTAHEKQFEYGLSLPGTSISASLGESHKKRCLSALALFSSKDAVATANAAVNPAAN